MEGRLTTIKQCRKCRLDITDVVRIRCGVCSDVDLCVECFAEGVEFDTHKNDHAYYVIDLLDFPIFEETWTAEEDLLLLEGLENYGMGNWADVAEHIRLKTLEETRDHYLAVYINSPNFPLPEAGKSFTKEQKEKLRERKRIQQENWKPGPRNPPKAAKPLTSQPSSHEVAGFMPFRGEFETEHENEAESVISSLGFQDDDSPEERELKHQLLEIYNWKLHRRYERREFILDHGLVNYRAHQALDKKRTKEEKEIHVHHRPFARFLTPPEFELFMEGISMEQKIRARIAQLQEYRRFGITAMAAVESHDGERKKKEAEGSKRNKGDPHQSDRAFPRRQGKEREDERKTQVAGIKARKAGTIDLTGAEGAHLLSPKEFELCTSLQVMPRAYVHMKEVMIRESNRQGSLRRTQAWQLVQDARAPKVFDFLVSAGWVRPPPRS